MFGSNQVSGVIDISCLGLESYFSFFAEPSEGNCCNTVIQSKVWLDSAWKVHMYLIWLESFPVWDLSYLALPSIYSSNVAIRRRFECSPRQRNVVLVLVGVQPGDCEEQVFSLLLSRLGLAGKGYPLERDSELVGTLQPHPSLPLLQGKGWEERREYQQLRGSSFLWPTCLVVGWGRGSVTSRPDKGNSLCWLHWPLSSLGRALPR